MAEAKKSGASKAVEDAADTAQKQLIGAMEQGQALLRKGQEQVIGAIEQGQALMLQGYEAMVDAVGKIDAPTVPVPDEYYKARADMVDSLFEFGSAVLESQRAFTRQVLEVTVKDQD